MDIDISCDWPNPDGSGGIVTLGPDGDFARAAGITLTTQRIIRRFCSNPRTVLPNGQILAADDDTETDYGVGLRRLVGQPVTPSLASTVQQRCRDGMLQEANVAPNPPPDAIAQKLNGGIAVAATFTQAQTMELGSVPRIAIT